SAIARNRNVKHQPTSYRRLGAPVQSRLMVDGSVSVDPCHSCCVLGGCAGAHGPFDSYLAVGASGGGFDQLIADPEPQQLTVDVDIAAGAGVVATDADLLPRHAHPPVGGDPAAAPSLQPESAFSEPLLI